MYLIRLLFALPLLLLACAEPEDKAPTLAVDPLSLDFGAVEVGAEGALPLTLTNSGGGSIAILSVSVTEGSDIWGVERTEEDAISAGGSVSVDVIMAPEEEGDFSGKLLVRTDLDEEGTIEVALLGSGAPSTVDADGDGYSPASGDCDEANAAINPGAEEVCDGLDNNCDGSVPSDEVDNDRDGHFVCGGDCDDADANVYPEAPEICDEKDSDCDGISADHDDLDEDGYSVCDGDCEDQEPLVSPVLVEECDGLDNDCSGVVDDVDADADGHSLCSPGGDCDDHDPNAHPVVVDGSYAGAGLGTDEEPYTNWSDAVANIDETCRTIVLLPGTYAVGWVAEDQMLTVLGGGEGPEEVILNPMDTTSRHFDISGGAVLELVNLTLSAGAGSGDGGAIRAIGSEVVLDGVIASDNHCTGDGGALGITSGTLSLTGGTQFEGNLADDDGGAVAVVSGQLIDIGGSRWQNNAGVRGGALLLDTSSAVIAGANFQVNSAADSGGAIMVVGGNNISIRRSQIWLNQASRDGGGVAIIDLNDPTSALTNLIIQDNEAGGGGGGLAIGGTYARFVVANNTLVANDALSGEGGGIESSAASAGGLYLWSNLLGWSGGDSGLWVADGSAASVGWNTVYASSSGTDMAVGSTEDIGENASENPQFTDFNDNGTPSDDDLSLAIGSPARDSGPADGSGPTGFTEWLDLDGSTNDRGHTGGPEAE